MLVLKDQKKLLLNLREPEQVLALVPQAKMQVVKGHNLVAVPHHLDVVRLLRNLGLSAPGTIRSYYDWPGRWKPFIHQYETAEFLSNNPRAFCLNGMGCIAGDDTVRVSRYGKSYQIDLRTLHRKFKELPNSSAWKARSLKGSEFGMNGLLDVLYKGEKQTLRITLEDGKTFRATPDHRIARPDGTWTEAGSLRVGDSLVTNGEVSLSCVECGTLRLVKESSVYRSSKRPCRNCKHKAQSARMAGDKNPSYKGGRFVDGDGYVRVRLPEHHRADSNGFVYEHIVVAEAAYGSPIGRGSHVHHVNGKKSDNRPENLEVLDAREHAKHHANRAALDGSVSGRGGVVVVTPKSSAIAKIEDGGVVDVYDLCMEAPHHNFVVNGVVVHNSGKTAATLWAFDHLRKEGVVRRALVISPLSTLERTWADEVFKNHPDMTYGVVHGSRKRKMAVVRDDYDVYIMNHDGIKDVDVYAAFAQREDVDLIVVDELASFRNSSTARWKQLNLLLNGDKKLGTQPKPWVWGLTGTPIPNEPTDAWGQCRLIKPDSVPRFFGAFRDSVMKPLTPYKWMARPDALDTVHRVMQPAIRFAREDCIDLPPTTYVTRDVGMTEEQTRLYNEMMLRYKTEFQGGQILAVNEAVRIGKLLQIVCGVAYTDTGDVAIPAKARVDEVKAIIEEAGAKAIVFVPLTGALQGLAQELSKDFSVEVIHGQTPKAQRDRIFSEFMHPNGPRVLVAQPGTMAHGLSLTSANTIIWYAPIHSAEIYEQANARIVRPGQKHNTLIARIQGSDLERRMYAKLEKRGSTQGVLLEMFKG